MTKDKLLKNIEDGILGYYLEIDHSVDSSSTISDREEIYDGQFDKYSRLSKKYLFAIKATIQKDRMARIVDISEASGRLRSLKGVDKDHVFSIFKRHVEEHGLAANYRNFDSMSSDEMINILDQLNLTALFDEIDKSLGDDKQR